MRLDQDTRPIQSAWTIGMGEGTDTGAAVGYKGVTAIKPYLENGQMAGVPWLEVWKGDFLYCRLNAAHLLEIEYQKPLGDSAADGAEPVIGDGMGHPQMCTD